MLSSVSNQASGDFNFLCDLVKLRQGTSQSSLLLRSCSWCQFVIEFLRTGWLFSEGGSGGQCVSCNISRCLIEENGHHTSHMPDSTPQVVIKLDGDDLSWPISSNDSYVLTSWCADNRFYFSAIDTKDIHCSAKDWAQLSSLQRGFGCSGCAWHMSSPWRKKNTCPLFILKESVMASKAATSKASQPARWPEGSAEGSDLLTPQRYFTVGETEREQRDVHQQSRELLQASGQDNPGDLSPYRHKQLTQTQLFT